MSVPSRLNIIHQDLTARMDHPAIHPHNAKRVVATSQLHTINHDPLPVEPTLRHFLPPLQHDVVALKPRVKVVPRGGDEGVLALQTFDDLLALGLFGGEGIC